MNNDHLRLQWYQCSDRNPQGGVRTRKSYIGSQFFFQGLGNLPPSIYGTYVLIT